MKRKLFIALTLLMAVTMQAQTYWNGTSNKVFSGSGTQTDPYLISTPEQLAGLAERVNTDKEDFAGKYIKLTADIYLTDFTSTDTANWKQWEPIAWTYRSSIESIDYGYFRGTFDGDNHTIYNMFYGDGLNFAEDWNPTDWDMNVEDYDLSVTNKALFGNLEGATLKNINMANAKMAADGEALLALNADANTVIRNCHVQGEMHMQVAGLVGTNNGLIENCSANITSTERGGGAFVGTNGTTGIIRNCTSTGFMRCTRGSGAGFVSSNSGLIEKCTANVDIQALYGLNTTLVNGKKKYEHRSGAGFVMNNAGGTIRECAAFGNLASDGTYVNYVWASAIAGFAYRNWGGRIESSYCTGTLRDVSDSTGVYGNPTFASFCYDNGCDAGHIVDDIYRGDIFNCYSTSSFRHHDIENGKNYIHAFVGSFHGYGGFDAETVEQSYQIGCYFNQDGLPATSSQASAAWDGIGKHMSEIQSQAFIDTLNLLASFLNLSQWELRDGLPRPTGVYTSSNNFFGGGDGTKANPYIIATKQHLLNMAWLVQQGLAFKDTYFRQTADIALNVPKDQWEYVAPTRWKPIGSPVSNPWYSNTNIREFKGIYDGGFHEVQNMYINNILDNQGFFGRLAKGARVKNLGVTDAYVRAHSLGILAGEVASSMPFVQCWTSGDAATQGEYPWGQGALLCSMPGGSYVLNCASSAIMNGHYDAYSMIYVDAVYGGFNVWAQDTLVNYLFTGCLNNGGRGKYGSFQHYENFFGDFEKAKDSVYMQGDFTPWMQSKELVNIYNYSVTRWNENHTDNEELQLHYWEWREGDYPRVSSDASFRPPLTITFNTNGGASVPTKYIYPDSEVLPPQRPLRSGYIFAGWYKDEALTQFFDWKTERPTSSMTLYARWHEDKRFDIDITPFQNEFTQTYHIKTAAQLRGFAAMQNGLWTWDDMNVYDANTKRYEPVQGNLRMTQAPMSFKGKTVVLDNDILLCDTTDWQYWGKGAFGLPWQPIGHYFIGDGTEGDHDFRGTFDGQGHTVYGMYIENNGMPGSESSPNIGLFAIASDSAVIRRVGIAASVIDNQNYDTRGQSGDAVLYWKTCRNCKYGMHNIGMLIGRIGGKVSIDQCYAEGNVYGLLTEYYGAALIGYIDTYWSHINDTISNCYSRVNVFSTEGTPTGCLARSDWATTYSNCYMAGITKYGITNCTAYGSPIQESTYFNKELGITATNCDGRGCTTNEMHAKATYLNWDFDSIWGRNDTINDGYPYLRAFHPNVPDSEDPIIVKGISLAHGDTTLYAGQSLQLVPIITPTEAENKKVSYSYSDWGLNNNVFYADWLSIDENGLITTRPASGGAGRSGKMRVTITSDEGSYSTSFVLTISQPSVNFLVTGIRRVGDTEWTATASIPENFIENFEYRTIVYLSNNKAYTGFTWSAEDETIFSFTPMPDTTYRNVNIYKCSQAIVRCLRQSDGAKATFYAAQAGGLKGSLSRKVVRVDPSSVTISQVGSTSTINTVMNVGSQQSLKATVYGKIPSGSSTAATTMLSYAPVVEWSSSDSTVLRVNESGLVTAVSAGTATITATVQGSTVKATTAAITVSEITATAISIVYSSATIYLGDSMQLSISTTPKNITVPIEPVVWSSSDESILSVDENGLIKAHAVGSATITATSGTLTKSVTFTVKAVAVTSVTMSETAVEMYVGQTYQLSATVNPDNATDKTITWSSRNTTYATVDENGLVTALKKGSATIRATATNGVYGSCSITILAPVAATGITLNQTSALLQEGETLQLTATLTPSNASTPVVWTSSDESVAIVSETGLVTVVGQGTAVITATAGTVSATCVITVPCEDCPCDPFVCDFTTKASSHSNYYDSWTYDNMWVVFGGANNSGSWNYVKMGGKSATLATANPVYVVNKAAFACAITSVKVTFPAGSLKSGMTCNDWGVKVYSDLTCTNLLYTVPGGTITGQAQELTIKPVAGQTWDAGYAIQVYWDLANTSSTNGIIWVSKIEYLTGEPTPPEPTYYTIRFLNWDGAELQSLQVEEGDMPTYTGATPTRLEDANYTYEFSGWSPAIVPATADADYTAQYTATEKLIIPDTTYYTVTFMDWDGTELLVEQVAEGHDAVGPATDPTREGYIFTGWSKPITNITSNLIVIAQYELIPQSIYYTIRFLNWDGAELQSSQVLEGDMPTYNGATPTKPEDDTYTYEFNGWKPAIVAATADADYTAQFTATEKQVTPPEKEAITVRLYPVSEHMRNTVYLYAWTGNGATQPCGNWPGTQLSKDAAGWWSYTFDKSIQDINIIWNSGDGYQTVDITGVTTSTCYRLNESVYPYIVDIIDCDTPISEGIEDIPAAEAPTKILIDNVIFILRGDKVYTLQGQVVE